MPGSMCRIADSGLNHHVSLKKLRLTAEIEVDSIC